ncbi:MAG: VCBS repeat-containing protein, partial [Bacteroidota bacterium]
MKLDDSRPASLQLYRSALVCFLFLLAGLVNSYQAVAQSIPLLRQITPFPVFDEMEVPYQLPFLDGFNTPRPQFVDIDADGDVDLFLQERSNQIMFFEHNPAAATPFSLESSHFQQLTVGEWFRFADIDGDQDLDLLTERSFSFVQYFENTGSAEVPVFELVADTLFEQNGEPLFADRQNIPNVTDIDCDGLPDLFVGRLDGTIRRYELVQFDVEGVPQFALADERFQDIEIVGETGKQNSDAARHGANTLAFVDFDGDEDQDLFWGDFFESGLLYFENKGTCDLPDFSGESADFPLNDPLVSSGYNAPTFGDVNGDGVIDLLVGVLGGAFSASSNLADNMLFFQGNEDGGLNQQTSRFLSNLDFGSDSLPVLHDGDGDGDLDLYVSNSLDPNTLETAAVYFFENRGDAMSPAFYQDGQLALAPAFNYAPAFGDLDADGDADMLVGSWQGPIQYLRQDGTGIAGYSLVDEALLDLPAGSNSTPVLVDLDGDDDLDVIAGEANGTLNFYQNTGSTSAPVFATPIENWQGIDAGRRSVPVFLDIDADGDQDLVVGTDQDGVLLYTNTGSADAPAFTLAEDVFGLSDVRRITPALADLDADNDFDLVIGSLTGGLQYFENQTVPANTEVIDSPLPQAA